MLSEASDQMLRGRVPVGLLTSSECDVKPPGRLPGERCDGLTEFTPRLTSTQATTEEGYCCG
jgi:hypothetical protein